MKQSTSMVVAVVAIAFMIFAIAGNLHAQPAAVPSAANSGAQQNPSAAKPQAQVSPGLPPSLSDIMANRNRRMQELIREGHAPRMMMGSGMPMGPGMMGMTMSSGMGMGMNLNGCMSPALMPSDPKTHLQWMELCGKTMQMWGAWMEKRARELESQSND